MFQPSVGRFDPRLGLGNCNITTYTAISMSQVVHRYDNAFAHQHPRTENLKQGKEQTIPESMYYYVRKLAVQLLPDSTSVLVGVYLERPSARFVEGHGSAGRHVDQLLIRDVPVPLSVSHRH